MDQINAEIHLLIIKHIFLYNIKSVCKYMNFKRRPTVAWLNKECQKHERITRAKYKKFRKDPNNKDKIQSFQRRRAIKQREFRRARKDSWHKYINSLNARTPTKKVWERLKK